MDLVIQRVLGFKLDPEQLLAITTDLKAGNAAKSGNTQNIPKGAQSHKILEDSPEVPHEKTHRAVTLCTFTFFRPS